MAQYLEQGLEILHADRATVVNMRQNADEIEKAGHPTDHAIKEIMQMLSAEYGDDIVLNEDFITTDRMYAGVQSIYKYWCRTCTALGQFPRPLEVCPLASRQKPHTMGARSGKSS